MHLGMRYECVNSHSPPGPPIETEQVSDEDADKDHIAQSVVAAYEKGDPRNDRCWYDDDGCDKCGDGDVFSGLFHIFSRFHR